MASVPLRSKPPHLLGHSVHGPARSQRPQRHRSQSYRPSLSHNIASRQGGLTADMPRQGNLVQLLDAKIKFVMTMPTRGGPVKMVYAVPIVPLILSLKPMKAGLIIVFCLYFGYLPVLLEFLKAVAQELGILPRPPLEVHAPIIDSVFRIPYDRRQQCLFEHLLIKARVWFNLLLLLLLEYAPARGRFMLRQKRRSVRHWLSARYGPITSLGSDMEDEAWLRRKNRDIMDVTHVFNANHVYTVTKDPNTFVKVPCLPEFTVAAHVGRGGLGNAGDGCQEEDDGKRALGEGFARRGYANVGNAQMLDHRAVVENEALLDAWEDSEDDLA